jgi:mediator of replication checkpoint protein 1
MVNNSLTVIAQNPKQEAFFHAIEDREEVGTNFLSYLEGDEDIVETQVDDDEDKENQPVEADLRSPKKRKLPGEFNAELKNRSPPAKRTNTTTTRKIFNPVELRQSLSFLIDETIIPRTQIYSSDHEEEDDEDDIIIAGSLTVTRTNTSDSLDSMVSSKSANLNIVNRLIRRQSSLEGLELSNGQAMAFAAPGAMNTSFKAPSLLRRATGLSTASASSTGSKTSSKDSVSATNGTRFGGSKKSNMHYQAKAAERRKVDEAADEKMKAQLKNLVSSKGKTILGGWRKQGASADFE